MTNQVEHIVCQTSIERDACRGSKYIQSQIYPSIYNTLEFELRKQTPVLFIGTPCQVAAVKQYVSLKNIDAEFLLTCDILCHGVGSPGIWKKFLAWKNRKITYLNFKDKRKGWISPMCIARSDDMEFSLRGYSWLYFSDSIMRPACHNCQFATIDRLGDLTIGDFWKVKSRCPEMYNSRGTSFLMVNTLKGELIFESIKNEIVYKEVSIEDIIQNNMQFSTPESKWRNEVFRDYNKMSDGIFFTKWGCKLFLDKLRKKVCIKL